MSQQSENCENRNDPDLVQAFLMKWWVESDFKAPNLPLSLRFKGSGCHLIIVVSNEFLKSMCYKMAADLLLFTSSAPYFLYS